MECFRTSALNTKIGSCISLSFKTINTYFLINMKWSSSFGNKILVGIYEVEGVDTFEPLDHSLLRLNTRDYFYLDQVCWYIYDNSIYPILKEVVVLVSLWWTRSIGMHINEPQYWNNNSCGYQLKLSTRGSYKVWKDWYRMCRRHLPLPSMNPFDESKRRKWHTFKWTNI